MADTTAIKPQVAYAGTAAQKSQAERIFALFRARGMFMSDNAPIRIEIDQLTAWLEEKEGIAPAETMKTLKANARLFAIETVETRTIEPAPVDPDAEEDAEPAPPIETVSSKTYAVTTRLGRVPSTEEPVNVHTFRERLMTPEPKVERPAAPVRERPRVDPSWATYTIPEGFEDDEEDEVVASVPTEPVTTTAPEPIDSIRPAAIADEDEAEVAAVLETAATSQTDTAAVAGEDVQSVVDVAEEVVVEDVPAPVTTTPAPAAVPVTADFSGVTDDALAAAIHAELGNDARVASFGEQWMSEDRVPRLSRGDLRRIKEYIEEQEQPLTDATLVTDILGVRPNSADFPLLQFAMNFRLSREHREFEFVGTDNQRFWNTSNSQQLGTTRRKPNEIGTDFRYLVEQAAGATPRSVTSIDHVVTFYEYTLGLLPYDSDLQSLLPAQLLPDQKSAVLTFEFPQTYTTYLVELRYPTPNRGGFLLGLDDFYAENLVPGAMITITATENDGHYKVEFLKASSQSDRLLELDDRRSPRYLFRSTAYECAIDDDWKIDEDRFPRLGSEKPLDDRIRRRPEAVVEATFERIGDQDGNSWRAAFSDLLAAVNIERPFSAQSLTAILESGNAFSNDGGIWTYVANS
jgi:hypothetical protein